MITAMYSEMFRTHQITPPQHIALEEHIPLAARFWAQGDVYMRREMGLCPRQAEGIPAQSIKIVQGDADHNAHIFTCTGGLWYPGSYPHDVADYGVAVVPDGEYGYLLHTGEHGIIALTSGTWRFWGQVSYEKTLRRITD